MFLYEDKIFLGKKIKQLRNDAGLSQAKLSEKIGMSEKNLSNIERGIQFPEVSNFLKLIDVLKVSLSEFGINIENIENVEKEKDKNKEELIKEIYLSNSNEISAFLSIIKTIKGLK